MSASKVGTKCPKFLSAQMYSKRFQNSKLTFMFYLSNWYSKNGFAICCHCAVMFWHFLSKNDLFLLRYSNANLLSCFWVILTYFFKLFSGCCCQNHMLSCLDMIEHQWTFKNNQLFVLGSPHKEYHINAWPLPHQRLLTPSVTPFRGFCFNLS